jgi:hypothetical protein
MRALLISRKWQQLDVSVFTLTRKAGERASREPPAHEPAPSLARLQVITAVALIEMAIRFLLLCI